MKRWMVYGLYDTSNMEECKYIGMSYKSLIDTKRGCVSGAKISRFSPPLPTITGKRNEWILEVLAKKKCKIFIKLLFSGSKHECMEMEHYLISHARGKYPILNERSAKEINEEKKQIEKEKQKKLKNERIQRNSNRKSEGGDHEEGPLQV